MKEKYLVGFGFLVLAIAATTGWASQVLAVPPEGFNLYDANDVYLGQVVGITNEIADSGLRRFTYTTYLPSEKGILQFNTDGISSGQGTLFDNLPQLIQYEEENCQGKAYISPIVGESWTRPWIVKSRVTGTTYKIASSTTATTFLSQEDGGSCENASGDYDVAYKLNPVTLPFDLDTITLPFKIKE